MNKRLVGILCGLGAASIWGGMYVVSKVVLDIIPPFLLVSLRLILGALTLAVLLGIRGFPNISRKQVLQVLGVGLVGYGISLSLQFLGTKLSTAANGSPRLVFFADHESGDILQKQQRNLPGGT